MVLQLKKHLLCKPDDVFSIARTHIKLSIDHTYIIPYFKGEGKGKNRKISRKCTVLHHRGERQSPKI